MRYIIKLQESITLYIQEKKEIPTSKDTIKIHKVLSMETKGMIRFLKIPMPVALDVPIE